MNRNNRARSMQSAPSSPVRKAGVLLFLRTGYRVNRRPRVPASAFIVIDRRPASRMMQ